MASSTSVSLKIIQFSKIFFCYDLRMKSKFNPLFHIFQGDAPFHNLVLQSGMYTSVVIYRHRYYGTRAWCDIGAEIPDDEDTNRLNNYNLYYLLVSVTLREILPTRSKRVPSRTVPDCVI